MVKFNIRNLNIWFGNIHALRETSLTVEENEILSIIGPSNSGKTTFLRMLNRLNELQPNFKMTGDILFAAEDLNRADVEIIRRKIGMVFALPLPLPLSIFENIAYGVRMHGTKDKLVLEEIVERSLKQAYLWEEVKDRLQESALSSPAASSNGFVLQGRLQ